MGSIYIYILKEVLSTGWSNEDLDGKVLKQGSAYLLDKIVNKLPKEHRNKFPYLQRLEYCIDYYDGEKTFLLKNEVKSLKTEFDTLLKIMKRKEFLNNVDADEFLLYLSKEKFPTPTKEEILKDLLGIKELIDYAVKNESNIYIDR